jgi:hypothetical protein
LEFGAQGFDGRIAFGEFGSERGDLFAETGKRVRVVVLTAGSVSLLLAGA